jgi:hypothetical protein
MKHLLNDLSDQEKNTIREQHEGGMKISIDNFKKLVETKSGDVKPLVNEQVFDDKMVGELNKIGGSNEPIQFFSDKGEKQMIGSFFVSEASKPEDGVVNIYPGEMRFSSPSTDKNSYRVLVFKCGADGLFSKNNNKTVYSRRIESYLKSKVCK